MQNYNTHNVLKNLISLTNERDVIALEQSLAQSLLNLIAPENTDNSKSVIIYRVMDIKKHLFSSYVAGNKRANENISTTLTQALSQCFKSGEHCIYHSTADVSATLFPLKNNVGHTIAIIAIENLICDDQLQKIISMMLQIFQNFIMLINDNEHDTLTGLLNRKTFEIKINKVLQKM